MSVFTDLQLQLDEVAGPTFWPAQQMYDAINASLLEVWSSVKNWQLTSATVTISSGADIVALPITSVMIPQFIIYSGIKIFITTHDLLQDWSNNWRNESPTRPTWAVQWDESHIRPWPKADQSYSFVVFGVPWPTEVGSTNTDVIGLEPMLTRSIALRAAAKLLEDSQPQLADAKQAEAHELQYRYERQQRNALGANIIRLRPAVAWDVAQQGDIRVGRKFENQV